MCSVVRYLSNKTSVIHTRKSYQFFVKTIPKLHAHRARTVTRIHHERFCVELPSGALRIEIAWWIIPRTIQSPTTRTEQSQTLTMNHFKLRRYIVNRTDVLIIWVCSTLISVPVLKYRVGHCFQFLKSRWISWSGCTIKRTNKLFLSAIWRRVFELWCAIQKWKHEPES